MAIKLDDYLHLYLGCWGIIKHIKPNRFARDYSDGDTAYLSGELYDYVKSGTIEFKPILRRLTDMTQVEILEMGRINWHSQRANFNEQLRLKAETTAYLLSRGFDLFSLIDADLAIKKQ